MVPKNTGRKRPEHRHAGGLERDDLEVTGQTAACEQHGDEERHRQRVREERRQHEAEKLEHERERNTPGDHEIGEVVDAVDEQEEREQRTAEAERHDELSEDVAVDDAHAVVTRRQLSRVTVKEV